MKVLNYLGTYVTSKYVPTWFFRVCCLSMLTHSKWWSGGRQTIATFKFIWFPRWSRLHVRHYSRIIHGSFFSFISTTAAAVAFRRSRPRGHKGFGSFHVLHCDWVRLWAGLMCDGERRGWETEKRGCWGWGCVHGTAAFLSVRPFEAVRRDGEDSLGEGKKYIFLAVARSVPLPLAARPLFRHSTIRSCIYRRHVSITRGL